MQGFVERHAAGTGDHGNLVIATVGDRSCHASWMAGPGPRRFDVMLVHYGDAAAWDVHGAEYTARRRGFKYPVLADIVDAHRDLLERYDRIWCPDDDIRADTAGIGRMFDIVRDRGFLLAQPAIAAGETAYATLRRVADTSFRLTPFVEVMCPLFARDAFLRAATLFRESQSGWGLDCVWSTWFPRDRVAIIDEVGVEHTGTLGRGTLYEKLAALGISPGDECEALIARRGGVDPRTRKLLVHGRIRLPRTPLPRTTAGGGGLFTRFTRAVGRALGRSCEAPARASGAAFRRPRRAGPWSPGRRRRPARIGRTA